MFIIPSKITKGEYVVCWIYSFFVLYHQVQWSFIVQHLKFSPMVIKSDRINETIKQKNWSAQALDFLFRDLFCSTFNSMTNYRLQSNFLNNLLCEIHTVNKTWWMCVSGQHQRYWPTKVNNRLFIQIWANLVSNWNSPVYETNAHTINRDTFS